MSDFLETANILKVENNLQTVKVSYMEFVEGEKDPSGYNTISVKVESAAVLIEKLRVNHVLSNEIVQELSFMHNVDAEEIVSNAINELVTQTKHQKLYNLYKQLGKEHFEKSLTKRQRLAKKYLKNYKPVYYLTHKSKAQQREVEMLRVLLTKIILNSNRVAVDSRRGPAKFIIVGGMIGSMLQDVDGFVFENAQSQLNTRSSVILIGTICDMKIFINPYLSYGDNTIVVGRTSKAEDYTGTYLLEGDPIIEKNEIAVTDDISRIAFNFEQPFTLYNTPNANLLYETFEVEFDKMPWWKRLLKL